MAVAVAATFALAGCGRDDNRARTNLPGSTAGTTGGTASSPTTPGSTPSPSGGGSAMSGGGAAPSGSTGASANGGVSSPAGTSAGTASGSGDMTAASPSASDSGTANMGTRGSGTPGGDTASSGSGSAAGTTGATGTTGTGTGTTGSSSEATPSSTPGKSSSLDSHIVGANVQLAADTSTAPAGAKLSRADKEFIEEAASGGLTEVEVGKMMSDRAKHPEVKRFAEMLVTDHTAANEELRRIAASSGVSLPPTPESKHRMMIERLANEKGGDIDRTFIKNFGVKEHEKDIKEFQKQAEKGDNPQLKAFAAKTLPKLKEHLAMAQKLESELAK
jgi:putative membrane protein